jgi:hypothetical protein
MGILKSIDMGDVKPEETYKFAHSVFETMPDAEWLECVLNGGDDRPGGRHTAGFAGTFDTERIEQRRALKELHLDVGHIGGTGQKIIGERGGDRLRLIVVAHPFEQRVADAMHYAADDLSFDNHRVDDPTAVVDHYIAQDTHAARFYVNFNLHGARSHAIDKRARYEVFHALEIRLS